MLDDYAVGFNPVHGFTSATSAHDTAEDDDGRPLIILYVGDYDPSGMNMSEHDLPTRFAKYDGDHIKLKRIALTLKQATGLPSFPATDKREDPRYKWFVKNYGKRCWELDAMDPNALRKCVEREIKKLIEPVAWERCEIVNQAEQSRSRQSSQSGGVNSEQRLSEANLFLKVRCAVTVAPQIVTGNSRRPYPWLTLPRRQSITRNGRKLPL